MNAHKTSITTKSSSKPASPVKKVAPASPLKVPGQLHSFPSNTTVDTMCSQEEEEEKVKSEAEKQQQEQQELHFWGAEDEEEDEVEEEHAQDAAATRAFAYLEELSQPKQPMAAPLKKVRSASNRWHLSLLHTEEEVEGLLAVRVLV